MLTLAFGMVFYTFLLKFYKLTGGDEGMRMLRPYLLGSEWKAFSKTAYLIGPYYYFSLAVLVLATLLMWRVVRSPFGLCLKTIRDNPLKAESLGVSVPRYRWYAFMLSAVYAGVGLGTRCVTLGCGGCLRTASRGRIYVRPARVWHVYIAGSSRAGRRKGNQAQEACCGDRVQRRADAALQRFHRCHGAKRSAPVQPWTHAG